MRVIFVLALFISVPAYAHKIGGCRHDHQKGSSRFCAEEVVPEGEVSSQQLLRLMDEAHHAIETEGSSSSFFGAWGEKFSFKDIALNAYRWYSAHKQRPEVANASANIVVMLLTSHAMETVGGVGLASFGMGQHSHLAQFVLTTIGVSVTVPGLDPLCIILVGAYSKWPKAMNRWLTIPRMFVIHGARAALGVAGIPEGYLPAAYADFAKQRFLEQMKKEGHSVVAESVSVDHAVFKIFGTNESGIELEFAAEPKIGMSLVEIRMSGQPQESPELVRGLKLFGTNIRELVLDLINGRSQSAAYVESTSFSNLYDRSVKIMPGAFPFHSFSEGDCESLLSAPSAPKPL